MLIASNFGQAWEVGEITTHTSYKAGAKEEVHAIVGIKLGLRSVNVTLLQTGKILPNFTTFFISLCHLPNIFNHGNYVY
jgi:hypothetical protein